MSIRFFFKRKSFQGQRCWRPVPLIASSASIVEQTLQRTGSPTAAHARGKKKRRPHSRARTGGKQKRELESRVRYAASHETAQLAPSPMSCLPSHKGSPPKPLPDFKNMQAEREYNYSSQVPSQRGFPEGLHSLRGCITVHHDR